MKIVCTFAPGVRDAESGKDVVLAVFDAFVDGKGLVVGLAVGQIGGQTLQDVKPSATGELVLRRLVDYKDFRYPNAPLIVAGVASVGGAAQRVRNVLQNAPEDCALALLCADEDVYHAAFKALNVDLQALAGKPQ